MITSPSLALIAMFSGLTRPTPLPQPSNTVLPPTPARQPVSPARRVRGSRANARAAFMP